ncbi:conserved membrane hypothetical protein [Candidatus Sulfopaludibacter sp. SbA6]|nr:conserved membrane hypothetical protein [Candidatus Sulfopaludibacter sp. SbA6]
MNKRVVLAGVLGAVAMFLWTFVAHMVTPLGEAGVRQIDNEQPLLSAMQSTLSAHGIYLFPKMAPGMDQAQYGKQIASGPSGMLIYFPKRDFSFGQALAIEFCTELLQALVAAWLLSLTRIGTFAGRLGFYALLGLIAAVATNVSYANWYGFPLIYTSAYMLTNWMGYLCAGLVAAAMKIGAGVNASPIPAPMRSRPAPAPAESR